MFSRPVDSVSGTQILVVDAGDRQITMYANQVRLRGGAPSAMILPVPCLGANMAKTDCGIKVMDATAAAKLFDVLKEMFAPPSAPTFALSLSASSRGAATLEVKRSGSYRYSIVPSLPDFSRLDHETFGLDPKSELASLLAEHYGISGVSADTKLPFVSAYAFLVCIIDATAAFAPIAYEHDKHPSGRVFVPTRHYHGNEPKHGASEPPGGAVHDWDHHIYALGCAVTGGATVPSSHREAAATVGGGFDLAAALGAKKVTLPFALPPRLEPSSFTCHTLVGKHPNDDLWLLTEAQLRKPGVCTFDVTGEEYAPQEWFTCVTCAMKVGEGLCLACAGKCHAGHATYRVGRIPCFCDCPAFPAMPCLCSASSEK